MADSPTPISVLIARFSDPSFDYSPADRYEVWIGVQVRPPNHGVAAAWAAAGRDVRKPAAGTFDIDFIFH
ncbi:hypothetical protein [Actinoalloteichus hoggarensis]|nr:hypothetical protein [Actinoalloteichus hoggarensis]